MPVMRTEGHARELAGARILVVDDNEDSRDLFEYALTLHGAEVRLASSASDAREILAVWTPAVIVTDLSMPIEDGFSLIESIRANAVTSAIPALALSGVADDTTRALALSKGFQKHLAKPVDIGALVLAIVGLRGVASAQATFVPEALQ